MDYVVGSVAALISGNVTPNRPKKLKKADTPMKHQPSPNVTPKSEFVDDRSIFLSPSVQKKKAIVKKSPKRIFQNPDLDVTKEDEGESTVTSPKADKVKKHLKEELEANSSVDQIMLSPKSLNNDQENNIQSPSSKKKLKINNEENNVNVTESPSKKKKKRKSVADEENVPSEENTVKENEKENVTTNIESTQNVSPKKKSKKSKVVPEMKVDKETDTSKISTVENDTNVNESPSKKKKKRKSVPGAKNANGENEKENLSTNIESTEIVSPKKKSNKSKPVEAELENTETSNTDQEKQKNKKKNKKKQNNTPPEVTEPKTESQPKKKNKNKKNKKQNSDNNEESETVTINSNAITNKDSDSEHESDDEIESENEEINKKAFESAPVAESSDEEEEKPKEKPVAKEIHVNTEDEVKRTIFVGNVPFSSKCKKEIKKIFTQYGQIDTVRIRTVPVKDARVTPKMAVIKNELHPDRKTVNVYVKFVDASSVDKALAANNTMLNGNHLRVSRSETTGAEHDPRLSVFVGNVPFALEDEDLRAKFEKCGEIVSVRIIRDKKTNAGKGFGYINFASKDGVELALALTEEDLTIKNRIMRVKRCTHPTQRKTFKPNKNVQNRPPQQFGRGRFPDKQNDKTDGAYRRVMNKRKHQDGNDGPPNKRQNLNQPHKEKKARKEFVGMTAEKKKKHKFNKGQKKKKVLSEILTKK